MTSPTIAPLALGASPPRRSHALPSRPPSIRGRLSRPPPALSLCTLLAQADDEQNDQSEEHPGASPSAAATDLASHAPRPSDGSPPRRKRRVRSRIARPKDALPFARRRLAVPAKFRRRGGGGGGGSNAGSAAHPAPAPVTAMDRSVLAAGYSVADDAAAAVLDDEDCAALVDSTAPAPSSKSKARAKRPRPDLHPTVAPLCTRHKLPTQQFTARRPPNAGRKFYKCARPRAEQCDFFEWADAHASAAGGYGGGDADFFAADDDDGGNLGSSTKRSQKVEGDVVVAAPPVLPDVTDAADALSLFAHDHFRPGQRAALDILLAGRSALAVLPTAGGKSLIYQLVAALLPGLVVVVSPLVSLMRAAAAALPDCLPAAVLSAGASRADVLDVSARARDGRLKLLFVAPERVSTHAFLHARLAGPHGPRVAAVVVDEAHCVAAWSHNFRVAYLRLPALLRLPLFRGTGEGEGGGGAPPVLALTATATCAARRDICQRFGIAREDAVAVPAARNDVSVTLSTVPAGIDAKAAELVRRLRAEPFASMLGVRSAVAKGKCVEGAADDERGAETGRQNETSQVEPVVAPGGKPRKRRQAGKDGGNDDAEEFGWRANKRVCVKRGGKTGKRGRSSSSATARAIAGGTHRSVIVYVMRQRDCSSVANYISASGLSAWGDVAAYHAGLESHERAGTQARFERGEIAVLVATVAFGMGVSYDVVGGVLHFDAPASIDALSQEIGRAARDGRPGFAHVFFCRADVARMRSRCHADGADVGSVRAAVRRLCDSAVPLFDGRTEQDKPRHAKKVKDAAIEEEQEQEGKVNNGNASTPDRNTDNAHKLFVLALAEDDITRSLDLKFETGETIAAELEARITGLTSQPGASSSLTLQFFTETPTALADPTTSPLRAADCATLGHLLGGARARAGRYTAAPAARGLPPGATLGALLARLRAGAHARVDRVGRTVVLVASGAALQAMRGHAGRDAADAVFEALRRAERTRVAAARDVVRLLERADDEPSDAGQTRLLREGMAAHFERGEKEEEESKEGDGEDTEEMNEARIAETRRACRVVLAEQGCGGDTAQTGRQVARVLHGLDGPRLRAKEWWRCKAWGRFVDVGFEQVLRIANEEVRARLSSRRR